MIKSTFFFFFYYPIQTSASFLRNAKSAYQDERLIYIDCVTIHKILRDQNKDFHTAFVVRVWSIPEGKFCVILLSACTIERCFSCIIGVTNAMFAISSLYTPAKRICITSHATDKMELPVEKRFTQWNKSDRSFIKWKYYLKL